MAETDLTPEGRDEMIRPKGIDDYEVRLGDLLPGERASLGKSLMDVQRERRINANYIYAIENCDYGAFETPSFVSGFVRSYARYLKLDQEQVTTTDNPKKGCNVRRRPDFIKKFKLKID